MLRANGVDLVFDVGAARGAYGRELRDFGYEGRIVSFEPMRAPHEKLVREAAGDSAWAVHQCALGETAGRATINIASNSDSSSLLPMANSHREAAPHVAYVATEDVEVARLDDLAAAYLGISSKAFLKLDTQGFEKQVLAGARRTLDRCVGMQLELSFVPLYEGGMLIDEAVSMAYEAGFRLAALDPGFAADDGRVLQADGVFIRAKS